MCCYHWEKRKTICPTNHVYQPGLLSTKFTPDIDFTDEPIVQCDVPIVKNTFVDVNDKNNKLIFANKFWYELWLYCFGDNLVCSFSF